jgi:hypothetical protein
MPYWPNIHNNKMQQFFKTCFDTSPPNHSAIIISLEVFRSLKTLKNNI